MFRFTLVKLLFELNYRKYTLQWKHKAQILSFKLYIKL